jgi:hypothetical protein
VGFSLVFSGLCLPQGSPEFGLAKRTNHLALPDVFGL